MGRVYWSTRKSREQSIRVTVRLFFYRINSKQARAPWLHRLIATTEASILSCSRYNFFLITFFYLLFLINPSLFRKQAVMRTPKIPLYIQEQVQLYYLHINIVIMKVMYKNIRYRGKATLSHAWVGSTGVILRPHRKSV